MPRNSNGDQISGFRVGYCFIVISPFVMAGVTLGFDRLNTLDLLPQSIHGLPEIILFLNQR